MADSGEEESEAAILFSRAKGDSCKNTPGFSQCTSWKNKGHKLHQLCTYTVHTLRVYHTARILNQLRNEELWLHRPKQEYDRINRPRQEYDRITKHLDNNSQPEWPLEITNISMAPISLSYISNSPRPILNVLDMLWFRIYNPGFFIELFIDVMVFHNFISLFEVIAFDKVFIGFYLVDHYLF